MVAFVYNVLCCKIYLLLSSAQFHLAILFHKVLHDLFGHSCGRRVHVVRRPLRQVTRTGKLLLTCTKVWHSGGSRVPGGRYLATWCKVPGYLPSGDPFFRFRPALGTATELPCIEVHVQCLVFFVPFFFSFVCAMCS